MVLLLIRKQNGIFDEDCAGSQDEGEEKVDVDVVPGAVKLPEARHREREHVGLSFSSCIKTKVEVCCFLKCANNCSPSSMNPEISPLLPEHGEDKDGRYEGDERRGIAGSVHLLEVGKVRGLIRNKREDGESR